MSHGRETLNSAVGKHHSPPALGQAPAVHPSLIRLEPDGIVRWQPQEAADEHVRHLSVGHDQDPLAGTAVWQQG